MPTVTLNVPNGREGCAAWLQSQSCETVANILERAPTLLAPSHNTEHLVDRLKRIVMANEDGAIVHTIVTANIVLIFDEVVRIGRDIFLRAIVGSAFSRLSSIRL